MGAFRPTTYTKRERAGLSAPKRKQLRKEIIHHLETHKGIRKILRQKTKATYKRLKAG
jgi:hypothetical protein